MFNGQRLAIARKRRRLTGRGLAELASLTPVTITRLETGMHDPELETVSKLAFALKYPEEFFFQDDLVEVTREAASFRSLTRMSSAEREAALSAGALAFALGDWVSERFNLPAPDLPDLSAERDPEKAANSLRQHWGLGVQPIGNMIRLMESKGIRVFSLSENTKTVDAFSCWRDGTPYVFLNTFKTAEHSRMDAAHELGHLVLHAHGGPRQGRSAENEANRFSSAFLMPPSDVRACLPSIASVEIILKAKFRWRVSAMALTYWLNKLSPPIISDWKYNSACIELTKRGYRTSEPNGIDREESIVWQKVLTQLWKERTTKDSIARELFMPLEELESLIFGLVGKRQTEAVNIGRRRQSGLQLV